MSFYARSFIYDGIPCEQYSLYIGDLASTTPGSGEIFTPGSSDISPLLQKIFRRPTPYLYGVDQTPSLTFVLSTYAMNGTISADEYSLIAKWLFGRQAYAKLIICQNDMIPIFFNALMTTPQIIRVGNQITGFTTNVLCDSPWGWKQPKTYEYDYSSTNYIASDTIYLNNESANTFYTYPTSLIITANIFGGSLTLTNVTDNNRLFGISLSPNEVVTINCDTQVVTSSIETYPINNITDKNFLRLLPGLNTINILGNISSLSMTVPCAVKVGG